MLRSYEIAVVLHPDLEIDIDSATNKIERLIKEAQGKINKKDNWGKRKLAYKIKGQEWGIYVFYQVSLEPDKLAQIESALRISEEVMRFLIVSLEKAKKFIVNKNQSKKSKPTKLKAKQNK